MTGVQTCSSDRPDPAGAGLTLLDPGETYPPGVIPDDQVTHAVIDDEAGRRVAEALREHATQVTVYPDRYALSNDIAARLPHREGYTRWPVPTGTVGQ